MGKTFNASVDWLGMVENPDQDVNPSVNGEIAQTGIEFKAPKRDGERINPNGGVSTHIMKTETIDGINWVSFPTLFQNEDGSWNNTYELMLEKDPDNWRPAMLEAKRRGELIHFGPNKEDALKYGEGSWKAQGGTELSMCSNGEWNGESVKTGCGYRDSAHNLYGSGAMTLGDISSKGMSGSVRAGLGYSTHVPYKPLTGHLGLSGGTRFKMDETTQFDPILDATGSVGIEGEFGGNSYNWREPWKYGAGIYGRHDLVGGTGTTAGLYGNVGLLSGKVGYNPNTGAEATIGFGLPIRQDGEEIIQGGMLPEVEVSALTDQTYNTLSQPQQNLYDAFVTPDGIAQTVDIGNSYEDKRQMHWKDALRMTDDLGVRNISNEPNLLGQMFPKSFSYRDKNDFRPHANPILKNIHVPKMIEPGDVEYRNWHNDLIETIKLGESYWVKQMTEEERLQKIKELNDSVEDVYRSTYFSDIIAEFAHIPEFWRSESFYNIPKSFMNDAMRFIQGKEMDHSRYHDKDHYEYKTHNAPDSFENQLREKYKLQDGGSLPKAQFGWNDFEESKIGKFVDAKGLRRDGEHMMNTIGDYFGYENTAEDARRMGLDASAMVNPLPDFINAYDHAQQGKHTDAALYAMFGILPFSAGPLVKGTKKAFNYLKNTNPLGKNAKIAKELSETLDAATLRNTTSKVDKKIIPVESKKYLEGKDIKLSTKQIKESLDNEAFVNQANKFKSKIPLTRALSSKGLKIKDGKLYSKTEPHTYARSKKAGDKNDYTLNRNTTHWSYGHIGNPGHGKWGGKSTAVVNDFDNLKKSGVAVNFDPTDTYFYTKGDFEIPSNSLILTRDKKLYNRIKKETGITNIKLFENTTDDAFEAIINSYSTKGGKGMYGKPTEEMINPIDRYRSFGNNSEGDAVFRDHLIKNYDAGKNVAINQKANDGSYYTPSFQGWDHNFINPLTGKTDGITPMHPDFDFSWKKLRDVHGAGHSRAHGVSSLETIETLDGIPWEGNHGISTWDKYGTSTLDDLIRYPKTIQVNEMDKVLRTMKNKSEALKISREMAEMNGFKSYKEFKESVDMTNFKKYGGQLQKAQNGTETERQKYIQFALDTESGYHYIRNKDSAVKKLGSDGKWDGKTYYKIYEDGKYYPHYVGDEKRATIGHGHAPVDRDILDEYKDGIDETQALDLLGEDIDEKLRLSEIYYNQRFGDNKWDDLTESEQFMLNDYTFNVRGGFHKTFKNFAKAIHDKDFKSAKKEYKRALGERNEIFMNTYLKPWMDIQEEKTTIAPPLKNMPLPIGTYPVDMTEPQKKKTSWWKGEEGWMPDELELPWFMDGAPINARGSSSSSATDIPDGSAAENATMSRSAMDPMPSLNNDLTINDNLALSNTISDLSEETTIPQVKYGGQYMWGLDLRSTKAKAGKEIKSDDIYSNDRYSQSAAKYKKMLPKYQSKGEKNNDGLWNSFKKSDVGRFVDARGFERMFGMDQGIAGTIGKHFGYGKDEGTDMALDATAIVHPGADFVNAGHHYNKGEYTDATLYGLYGILPFTAGPLVSATKKHILNPIKNWWDDGVQGVVGQSKTHTYNPATKSWVENNAPKVQQKILQNNIEYIVKQDYLTNKITKLQQGKIKITEEIKQFKINNPGKTVPKDLTKVDNVINSQLDAYDNMLNNVPPTYTHTKPGDGPFGMVPDYSRPKYEGPTLKSGNDDIIKKLNKELEAAEKLDLDRIVGDYKWDDRNIFKRFFDTPKHPFNIEGPYKKPFYLDY